MQNGWWWHRASAGKRLALAVVGVLAGAVVVYLAVTDPDFYSGRRWFALIVFPLVLAFYIFQALRAGKELKDKDLDD